MKKTTYLLITLAMLLVTACHSNEADDNTPDSVVRVSIPIELITRQSHTDGTRATGDPGIDDVLPATLHLYAWACYQNNNGENKVDYTTAQIKSNEWEDDTTEDTGSHYSNESLELMLEGVESGKLYVIGTNTPLTDEQVQTINALTTQSQFNTLVLSMDDWTSTDLRDLYSNPIGDTQVDDQGLANGVINKVGNKITIGTVRLYHCAAKVDFKWEVDEALRPATRVTSITCNQLPTQLKVFEPTANPVPTAPGASCLVLGAKTTEEGVANPVNLLTPANQYMGRAYAYVLQPADDATTMDKNESQINYTVTFNGRTTPAGTTTTAAASGVYTTWYRVVANVKD